MKVAGLTDDQLQFEGPARVFDGEDGAMEAILAGAIQPGTVLVIRYEGPKGGPGHARDAGHHRRAEGRRPRRRLRARSPTAASAAARGASASATWRRRRSTAGRSPSSTTATASVIDVHQKRLDLLVDDAELRPPPGRVGTDPAALHRRACSAKYAQLVQGAETGAITNPL